MADVISRFASLIGGDSQPQLDLDIDEALDVLSNKRRRLAIRFIHVQGGGEFDLNEVVRYIATEEYGHDFDSMERKRVYISMYQTHIEQLVEADVIQPVSDGETHQYRPDVAAESLFSLLTTAEDVLEVSD